MNTSTNFNKNPRSKEYCTFDEWEDSKHNKRTDKKKHDRSQRQAKRNWS